LARGELSVEEATAFLDEAIAVFGREDDVRGEARAELMYAYVSQWVRRFDSALVHCELAEVAYQRLGLQGHTDSSAVVYATLGATAVQEAIQICEAALARHPDSPRRRAYLLVYLGYCRALSGEAVGAREAAAAALSHLEELGEELGLGTAALGWLGDIAVLTCDWPRAEETWRRGLEYTRDRPGLDDWHAYFLARLGQAALERADVHAAVRLAERASTGAIASDVETNVWWRRVGARALAATGHSRKAVRLGRESVAIADETDDLVLRSGARLDLAEVQLGVGRTADAVALIQEALGLLERKGAVLAADQGRERFADLLLEAEDGGADIAAPPRSR
jgi:tetratricopeptide (TPR) repeat protein